MIGIDSAANVTHRKKYCLKRSKLQNNKRTLTNTPRPFITRPPREIAAARFLDQPNALRCASRRSRPAWSLSSSSFGSSASFGLVRLVGGPPRIRNRLDTSGMSFGSICVNVTSDVVAVPLGWLLSSSLSSSEDEPDELLPSVALPNSPSSGSELFFLNKLYLLQVQFV